MQDHAIEPELMQPPPRRVQPNSTWWAQRIMGLVCVLVFVGIPIGMWLGETRPVRLLAAEGRTVSGQVIGKRTYHGKSTSYRVDYTFRDASGVGRVSSHSVRWARYISLNEGGPVEVTYLPDRPDVSRPWRVTAEDASSAGVQFLVFAIIFGIVSGVGVYACEWDARKHYALAERGEVAAAYVLSARKVRTKNGAIWRLTYTFADRLGREHEARVSANASRLRDVREGSRLTVLYLPERPKVTLPYAALNVRVIG